MNGGVGLALVVVLNVETDYLTSTKNQLIRLTRQKTCGIEKYIEVIEIFLKPPPEELTATEYFFRLRIQLRSPTQELNLGNFENLLHILADLVDKLTTLVVRIIVRD